MGGKTGVIALPRETPQQAERFIAGPKQKEQEFEGETRLRILRAAKAVLDSSIVLLQPSH